MQRTSCPFRLRRYRSVMAMITRPRVTFYLMLTIVGIGCTDDGLAPGPDSNDPALVELEEVATGLSAPVFVTAPPGMGIDSSSSNVADASVSSRTAG
jgi:hypothetical protein